MEPFDLGHGTTTIGKHSQRGEKVQILDHTIHYEKLGNGEHYVFLMPGTLGFGRMDFSIQLENMDRNKFTIVVWDPPGFGYSRPPDFDFSIGFYHREAKLASHLLKSIGIQKTSVVGWSGGATTALIMAAQNPELVEKLVVFGAPAFVTKPDTMKAEAVKDMNMWNPQMKAPFVEFYGEEYVQKSWNAWVEGIKVIYEKRRGDICRNELRMIKCPTLLLHGTIDPIVSFQQALYIKERIKDVRFIEFEDGKHNLHQQFPEKFNTLVEEFLLK